MKSLHRKPPSLLDQLAADIQPPMRPTGVDPEPLGCAPGTGRTVLNRLARPAYIRFMRAVDAAAVRLDEPTTAERCQGIGLLYATRHPGSGTSL
jgi:hypothetical protein